MMVHLVAPEVGFAREEVVVTRPLVHVVFWPGKISLRSFSENVLGPSYSFFKFKRYDQGL